eukprot:1016197_1
MRCTLTPSTGTHCSTVLIQVGNWEMGYIHGNSGAGVYTIPRRQEIRPSCGTSRKSQAVRDRGNIIPTAIIAITTPSPLPHVDAVPTISRMELPRVSILTPWNSRATTGF